MASRAQVYHTCVRTLDELGQAAGRLLALHRFLAEHPDRKRRASDRKQIAGRLHVRKIQKMQWTERAGKRERNRVEFWLDVVVLEPHLLEGVPLPWMLTMDDLETWLSLQPAQPEFLGQVKGGSKSPNSAATYGQITHTMALLMRLCQAADMINEHHRGPSSYLSCVPRYSLAAGKLTGLRQLCENEYAITSNEKAVLEGLERATSTRVGNLSIVFHEWLQGAASPPSPPLSSQASDSGSDAAVPSGEEWPALGLSPSQEREREPPRVWPANASRGVPKINAADVQRMAAVRNAGLIWDSMYTEVNPDDGNSWVSSSRPQRVARSPLATVSVVCTI